MRHPLHPNAAPRKKKERKKEASYRPRAGAFDRNHKVALGVK